MRAPIFDLGSTLVDALYAHVFAWLRQGWQWTAGTSTTRWMNWVFYHGHRRNDDDS